MYLIPVNSVSQSVSHFSCKSTMDYQLLEAFSAITIAVLFGLALALLLHIARRENVQLSVMETNFRAKAMFVLPEKQGYKKKGGHRKGDAAIVPVQETERK